MTVTLPPTSNSGSYTVSWSGVSGATSYTLQEQVNGGGWTVIQSSSATSDALGGKGNGSYGYQAQGCNAGGCGPGSGTGTITVALIPAVPNAPTLSVTGPSNKPVVHASWAAVATATSYTVEETDPDSTVSNFYAGPNTTASALILQTGAVKFRTQACNAVGCSAFSGYSSVTLNSGNGNLSITQPAESSSSQGGAQ